MKAKSDWEKENMDAAKTIDTAYKGEETRLKGEDGTAATAVADAKKIEGPA